MSSRQPVKPATSQKYLVVHGHFYQPPRENPWIEEIEIQQSAAPFHNWNQKIDFECYQPNSMARIYDEKNKIVDLVNNFELMSFNFGPTLLSWLEKYNPYTYEKIIRADHVSRQLFSGHGNAIAQGYNHLIMPLATERDRLTQIRWGVADFKHRFGRDPEAMWLPETAVNNQTLRDLIHEGLKFVILSPWQAQAIKRLERREWHEVSDGHIDTTRPYRYFVPDAPGKYIDIFFFQAELSGNISFGSALQNADTLVNSIEQAYFPHKKFPQLVNVATDGETFGHHKTFGDLTLAYTLKVKAAQMGIKITNYAEYLEKYPPQFEVKIKLGESGDGTSWSCAHGVERWRSDCGCHTDGPDDWNQAWRKPLRGALDAVRDKLTLIFEQEASKYFKDIWQARDAYIRIILDRSSPNINRYLADYQIHKLTPAAKILALKLLEMERHAMLMYTSCGWFFSEVSGLETVQIIKYAARAIQLAQEFTDEDLEGKFLKMLAKAPSNIARYGNGRGIYNKLVQPYKVDFAKVTSHYAISSIFEDYPEVAHLYCYRVQRLDYRQQSFGNLTLVMGHIKISSEITRESVSTYFALLRFGVYDFRCSVKCSGRNAEYLKIKNELFGQFSKVHVLELNELLDKYFGRHYLSLKDLFLEERRQIVNLLSRDVLKKLESAYYEFYEENWGMVEVFKQVELPLPAEYLTSAEYILNQQLNQEVARLESPFTMKKFGRVFEILQRAEELELTLKAEASQKTLDDFLLQRVNKLKAGIKLNLLQEIDTILQVDQKLRLGADKRIVQDIFFGVLKEYKKSLAKQRAGDKQSLVTKKMASIAQGLGFNIEAL